MAVVDSRCFDPDLVSVLGESTRAMGIELHLQRKVLGVERVRQHLAVRTEAPRGARTFEADMVVHGAGRVPEIDDLDLEKGGVERAKRGIRVNEYLQSVFRTRRSTPPVTRPTAGRC